MTRKILFYSFLIACGYFIAFKLTYTLLENEKVYTSFFASFMPTYENQNGDVNIVYKPFTKITESGYTLVDAASYSYIKDNFYNANPNVKETNSVYGFFPLFPLIWKFFSGYGIIILNYFLHFVSIVILAFVFCKKKILMAVVTIISLPTLTVFLLPYTEALFMFSISIALLGYKEKNKYLYFSGLIMASATRPVFLLFLFSLIATELFQFLCNKKIQYKHLLVTSTIVLSVTFIISLIQYTFHKQSLFTFMTVQNFFGTYFRIPNTINDWSIEGYGMNVWALLFCVIFGITSLISKYFKKSNRESNFNYWYYFSWFYLIATCIYVLLFQGGCLHSLYRYTLCSPFFYIIIFNHINILETLSLKKSLLLTCCFIISCLLFFHFVSFSSQFGFSKIGFVLLMLNLLFFIVSRHLNNYSKYIIYIPLIIVSILWNCYLYNMFFSRAWIFL